MRTATHTLALASACFFATQLHGEDTAHEKVLKRFIGTRDVVVMSEPTGGERSSPLGCKMNGPQGITISFNEMKLKFFPLA